MRSLKYPLTLLTFSRLSSELKSVEEHLELSKQNIYKKDTKGELQYVGFKYVNRRPTKSDHVTVGKKLMRGKLKRKIRKAKKQLALLG